MPEAIAAAGRFGQRQHNPPPEYDRRFALDSPALRGHYDAGSVRRAEVEHDAVIMAGHADVDALRVLVVGVGVHDLDGHFLGVVRWCDLLLFEEQPDKVVAELPPP